MSMAGVRVPKVLSVAGMDPSGGAGLLADIKTFSALGAYGCGVVAALTAQNTQAVTGIHTPSTDFLRLQLDTLLADVAIDAAKLGMLAGAEIVQVTAERLAHWPLEHQQHVGAIQSRQFVAARHVAVQHAADQLERQVVGDQAAGRVRHHGGERMVADQPVQDLDARFGKMLRHVHGWLNPGRPATPSPPSARAGGSRPRRWQCRRANPSPHRWP